ncbi:TIGR03750 family conjugal transfer protein [Pseudomonas fuscovaginae UPB0736]|nr:TIGR03750 family conjugal transfer protein [Pseudomonas fuscovaginae]UUQ67987.1 TIGR03750 family conjugal transfer protein [Pseudomonas fuscovaginae UPB0736]
MLCIGLGLFTGWQAAAATKRGKPQTWLYRYLQWRLATSCPC